VHDFPHLGKGKAIPYGTYDVARDEALVNVGITQNGEFAVESIRRWWRLLGGRRTPRPRALLICADAEAATGTGCGRGKFTCSVLSDHLAPPIIVCHYPPGTSKVEQD